MGNYKNSKRSNLPKTKFYGGTQEFPVTNIPIGTKAIDISENIVYYWNGDGWFKANSTTAVIPRYTLIGPSTIIYEGDIIPVELVTTNTTPSDILANTYYTDGTIQTPTIEVRYQWITDDTYLIPVFDTGSFSDLFDDDYQLVIELQNGYASLTLDIKKPITLESVWLYDEQLWTNGQRGTWTVPDGVSSISVAALGGGNSATQANLEDIAGGGGALAWTNNIPVVPGQILSYNASRAGITFNEGQNTNESSYLKNEEETVVYVLAEKGHSQYSAADAGISKGSGGRASVGIGDVTHSGGNGTFGTLDGVRGGSAAGWTGTNTIGNINYTTGRGGYGTGPYGDSPSNGAQPISISGADLSPPDNSNAGAKWGGGGGAKNPNRHQGDPTAGWGGGAGGFLRIVYPGNLRQFPSTNVAATSSPEEWKIISPNELQINSTVSIIVSLSVPEGSTVNEFDWTFSTQSAGVTASGTASFGPEQISATVKKTEIDISIPSDSSNGEIGTFTLVNKFSLDIPIVTLYELILDFTNVDHQSSSDTTYLEDKNITKADQAEPTWIKYNSLRPVNKNTDAAPRFSDIALSTTGDFEIQFYFKWDGQGTADGFPSIFSSINPPSIFGATIAQDQIWVGSTSGNDPISRSGTIRTDSQWHHYRFKRENGNLYYYRDFIELGTAPDTRNRDIYVMPFQVAARYVNFGSLYGLQNWAIQNIRLNVKNTDNKPGLWPEDTINVTNNGASSYALEGLDQSTHGTNNNDRKLCSSTSGFGTKPGQTLFFEVDAPGHPFYIKDQELNGTSGAVTANITNNGTASGFITWTPPITEGKYYWQCSVHAIMKGRIANYNIDDYVNDLTVLKEFTATGTSWAVIREQDPRWFLEPFGPGILLFNKVLNVGSSSITQESDVTSARFSYLEFSVSEGSVAQPKYGLVEKSAADALTSNNSIDNLTAYSYDMPTNQGSARRILLIDLQEGMLYTFDVGGEGIAPVYISSESIMPGDYVFGLSSGETPAGATPNWLVRKPKGYYNSSALTITNDTVWNNI